MPYISYFSTICMLSTLLLLLPYTNYYYHTLLPTRLLQRYQNVKAELEAQQNLERIRMEKMAQSGGLTSVGNAKSRTMKSSKRNTLSA